MLHKARSDLAAHGVPQQEDRFSPAFLNDSFQGAARVLEVVLKALYKHPLASGLPVATQVKCACIEAQIIQACGYMIVAATVLPEPVYEQDALLAMDAKKLMKLTCKVLRKKEKQVTMMCAGKRPTPDELALLIMNAPSQLETKELLAAKEAQPAAAPSEAPAVEPRPPDSAPPPSTPRREANWSAEWRAHHSATPPLLCS